ncbi:oncostatin-M-specific receptor subunit beta [Microcaecilia unicolor]|uniref:Oncostatin-M-specific receptor subunit beta n=1 Tax=Microcaecilia unicolor TaxID=1415580 RepID=A0A6P7X065_9AMPH|nr:oncostatin-M-specific receptor subunit beta [Microcaecilia unicolor]XP_030048920.1 oncostatin-M-specific receptor subunit beta [Microcaecilia unicolor]XP_030048921.1 oncostatin-M-specific receptor subunit beta [Microcaecilia unicolor]XP_030048922.1 oncostatin-M-specific receptor subunit beta [Microcaecilia unicolor]XP_030048923.1 oncostatin-M-specific receptor subunit beta [Microcaecilia unicolor]
MDLIMILQTVLLLVLESRMSQSQEPVVVPPLDLKVSNDSFQEYLFLEWNVSDWAYESELKMLFQIQVSQTEKRNIIWMGNYSRMLSKSDKGLRWNWHSHLPLQCTSHSVRIRSAVDDPRFPTNEVWSDWTSWKTLLGLDSLDSEEPFIFPKDKIVKAGSNVTFCCIAGKSQSVLSVEYKGSPYPVSYISSRSVKITVSDVSLSRASGTNVVCGLSGRKHRGTVLFVSQPPEKPTNVSCETQDLKNLICSWFPGETSNLSGIRSTNYSLYEWFSQQRMACSRNMCSWPIDKNRQIYNFTLTAWNALGERNATIVLDVTHRVCPRTPTDLLANHLSATNVILYWTLRSDYSVLRLCCQTEVIKVKNGNVTLHNISVKGLLSMSHYNTIINQLQPYTIYSLRVRCSASDHFWKWSNWSEKLSIRTREVAPTLGLDIWREVRQNAENRTVIIYWKPLSENETKGEVLSYHITWGKLDDSNMYQHLAVSVSMNNTEISIDGQPYIIRVTARNMVGTSPPSEIRIAKLQENDIEDINEERVNGTGDGIHISWKPEMGEVSDYIVQWCNFPKSENCDFQWKKYHNNTFSDVIKSAAFQPGVRYNFQVYASKADGAHLLEKKTGYMKELAPAIKPAMKVVRIKPNSLVLTWNNYPTDDSQPGFISAYYIYVKVLQDACSLKGAETLELSDGSVVCRFTIGNPEVKSYAVDQLKPNTKYAFSVVALTTGGESAIDFSTKADTSYDWQAVILAIVTPVIICLLLLLILFLACYWKRMWLKDTCFPEIPDPNKSNILTLNELKINSEQTILNIGNCITSTVEVVNISKENKLQLCKQGMPAFGREGNGHAIYNLEDQKFGNQPTWINFFENEKGMVSPNPNPFTTFENLTYCSQLESGSSSLLGLGIIKTNQQNQSKPQYQQYPYLDLLNKDSSTTLPNEGTSSAYRSQMAVPNASKLNDVPISACTVECLGYKAQTNFSLGLLSRVISEDNTSTEEVNISVSPRSTNSTTFLLPD